MAALLPEAQGLGYGTRAIRELMRRLKQRGYEKMALYTDRDNRSARACYRKCGFEAAEALTETMSNGKTVARVMMKRKLSETSETAAGIRAAVRKKSFELNYSGGTIWCEHLDGMGELEQEVIDKFRGDLPKLLRPSVSSCMIIDLDDTVITEAIRNAIVNGLIEGRKPFRKIAFVGVDRRHHTQFREIHDRNGAAVRFLDDYEQAKEWVL